MNMLNDRHKKWIYLAGGVAAVGLIVLAYLIGVGMSHVTTDDAYVTGRIHSIASKVPGTVWKLNVNDNQNVGRGDLLVEIDPVDYALRVNEAKAALEVSRAALAQAARDKARAEALYQDKVLPKDKYEHALTDYQLAKAKNEEDAQKLKIAQQNLKYTKIYSPARGYVTQRSVEAGNQIQAGQPLMAVVPLDDIWVVANYKETQLKDVRPGQRVMIRVDTYPGKVFRGRVDSIMAGTGAVFSLFPPENALGNYVKVVQRIPVKIVFDKTTDEGHVLRVGMSCVPTILTKDE